MQALIARLRDRSYRRPNVDRSVSTEVHRVNPPISSGLSRDLDRRTDKGTHARDGCIHDRIDKCCRGMQRVKISVSREGKINIDWRVEEARAMYAGSNMRCTCYPRYAAITSNLDRSTRRYIHITQTERTIEYLDTCSWSVRSV